MYEKETNISPIYEPPSYQIYSKSVTITVKKAKCNISYSSAFRGRLSRFSFLKVNLHDNEFYYCRISTNGHISAMATFSFLADSPIALTLILTSRQWQQSLKYIATRLLARWAARHPVDRHLLKKIVLFFICPLINCVIPENIHTFPTEGIFL